MLAIANELDGYERADAARLAGMSDQALRDVIKRLNAEEIDGLYDRPRSGRPRRLTPEQEAEIKAACSPVRHRGSSIAPAAFVDAAKPSLSPLLTGARQ